jgi:hypothetical protein
MFHLMVHNDPVDFGFFTSTDGETLIPTPVARSAWSDEQIHGVAVSGAMARAMERVVEREDLRPARWTVDLFRPGLYTDATTEVEVLRDGPRIALVETRFVQAGETKARATAVWLKATQEPTGRAWSNPDVPAPPPPEVSGVLDGPTIPWFTSDSTWSQDFGEHANAGRHTTWQFGVPIVAGELHTPFQSAASIADATSLVVNWSDKGVEWINTDISLSLSRLPRTQEVGLRALDRSSHDGIGVGTVSMFDRDGVIGTCTVTCLANAKRTVDMSRRDLTDEARASSVDV